MARSRQVSMADVARHAGVSPQTVSRVSNGQPGVLEPTRRRVLEAMTELRYRPNSAARALKRGSFRSIAVVMSDLQSTGNLGTLRSVVDAASARDYSVTIRTIGRISTESLHGAFDRLNEAAVDGAVLLLETETIAQLDLSELPFDRIVIVDSHVTTPFPGIDSDQAAGTRAAVDHLLALGHESVHHIAGPAQSFAARARKDAWEARLREHGREVPVPIQADWSAHSGYQAGHRIADEGRATAVFVANDEMTLGLMRALGERRWQIPGDISVVGFDDIALAPEFPTPLTTVHQDFAEVGRLCVDMLIRQIETGAHDTGLTLVPTRLVVRSSTGPAPR